VSSSGPTGARGVFFVPWLGRFATTLADGVTVLVRPPRAPARAVTSVTALRRFAGVVILAIVAVAATMMFVDAAAMEWQKRLQPSIVQLFEEITDYGRSGWLLVPIAALMLAISAISSPTLGRISNLVLTSLSVRLGYLFLAIALPGLVVTIGKRLIGRVRPSDLGPFAYEPLSWRASYASLPSGHATSVFAALVAIGILWPRTRPILWLYALVIALSRIIVSAHYPSDVLAGALCGVLGAVLVRDWFAVRRLGFFVAGDGSVRPLPGPSFARLKRVARRRFAE
jgi:undecaprenyl-diphosphatase